MRGQQLLLLCVVMGLAVAMAQEQQDAKLANANKHHKKHHEHKYDDEDEGYYPKDDGHDYPRPHYKPHSPKPPKPSPSPKPAPPPPPPPPPPPAPKCDCTAVEGFSGRALGCVDCNKGTGPDTYNATTCKTNETSICIKIGNYSCTYPYRNSTTKCADKDGPCDLDDFCTGKSASCPDNKRNNTYVCKTSDNPCIKPTKCNGRDNYCPGPKPVKNGVPCSLDYPGLYQEAIDDDGKVYLQSKVATAEAEKKGWVKCHRCYDGECKAFKYEWMKHVEHKKSRKHHTEHKHTYAYEDEDYEKDSKAAIAGKKTKYGSEFEPEFYCHSKYELEGYPYDGDDEGYDEAEK